MDFGLDTKKSIFIFQATKELAIFFPNPARKPGEEK